MSEKCQGSVEGSVSDVSVCGVLHSRHENVREKSSDWGKQSMIVQCPYCGKPVVVNGFGRRPLNCGVTKVCDALQAHGNVLAASNELGCSRAYIYKVLKANGLNLKQVIKGKVQHN